MEVSVKNRYGKDVNLCPPSDTRKKLCAGARTSLPIGENVSDGIKAS